MKQFKARAERMSDIKRFMHSYLSPMQIDIISINPVGGESQFPDREVTFASKNESLEDVKTRMNRIPDLHCMFETVQLIDDYTGERTYRQGTPENRFDINLAMTMIHHVLGSIENENLSWENRQKKIRLILIDFGRTERLKGINLGVKKAINHITELQSTFTNN
ncbi:MAG: hypothetical protein JKY96_00130 [Phycisphaerales bacterium]|nr:hypothetical protein [Phycisphaerales bacterium]